MNGEQYNEVGIDADKLMAIFEELEQHPRVKEMLGANPLQSIIISGRGDIRIVSKEYLADENTFLEVLEEVMERHIIH